MDSVVGKSIERVEDPALLSGRAMFTDDYPAPRGTLHAAILRSPHAHAEILSIDSSAAARMPGVAAIFTGEDVKAITSPFLSVLHIGADEWPLAVGKVRFAGEAVALVLAADRYVAEDAIDEILVEYRPLDPVVTPADAMATGATPIPIPPTTTTPRWPATWTACSTAFGTGSAKRRLSASCIPCRRAPR
jgi:2-furoyl-CoA dehydrogenase large subunit